MTKQAQPFELGQRVLVRAHVWTEYLNAGPNTGDTRIVHNPHLASPYSKVLLRQEFVEPIIGIIVGYTWKATGMGEGHSGCWDDTRCLIEDKRHKVWLVAESLRYERPIVALETDIEKGG